MQPDPITITSTVTITEPCEFCGRLEHETAALLPPEEERRFNAWAGEALDRPAPRVCVSEPLRGHPLPHGTVMVIGPGRRRYHVQAVQMSDEYAKVIGRWDFWTTAGAPILFDLFEGVKARAVSLFVGGRGYVTDRAPCSLEYTTTPVSRDEDGKWRRDVHPTDATGPRVLVDRSQRILAYSADDIAEHERQMVASAAAAREEEQLERLHLQEQAREAEALIVLKRDGFSRKSFR